MILSTINSSPSQFIAVFTVQMSNNKQHTSAHNVQIRPNSSNTDVISREACWQSCSFSHEPRILIIGTNICLDFFIIKPTDPLISQFYFGQKMNLYMFRAVPLPIIRSSFTVHLALVYVIRVCRQISNRAGMELQSCMFRLPQGHHQGVYTKAYSYNKFKDTFVYS
jgi:hypothetical protein